MSESTTTEFDDGRYLYCAVKLDGETPAFEAQGVENEPVRVLAIDDIGIVMHDCASLYDTEEVDVVRKWVLQHQQVVDEAGETFGTPLPFQFDTILTGTDERVREWVAAESGPLGDHLETLAGHWEYRIELRRDESRLEDRLASSDDRLGELRTEIDDSGTGYLRKKQYEKRLVELKRERRAERSAALESRLTDLARTVTELGDRTTLDGSGEEDEEQMSTQARFTILAAADQEDAIGEMLDEVAAEADTEVRFTGPWPPYSFTPDIGGEDAAEQSR